MASNVVQSALTPRETEILIAAFVSLEDNKMDMPKFIKYSGFANANSARSNFAPLRKLLLEMAGEDGLTIPSLSARTKGKRKTKADGNAAEVAGTDDATPAATPAKKRRSPKKAKVAEEETAINEAGDENEDEVPSSGPAKKARAAKKTQVVKNEESAQDGKAKAKARAPAKKRGTPSKAGAVKEGAASEEDGEEEETAESA